MYDVALKETHQVEVSGGEDAPFYTDPDANNDVPDWVTPLYSYGSFVGWDKENNLILEVDYKDVVYTYRSADVTEPWILEYEGIKQ